MDNYCTSTHCINSLRLQEIFSNPIDYFMKFVSVILFCFATMAGQTVSILCCYAYKYSRTQGCAARQLDENINSTWTIYSLRKEFPILATQNLQRDNIKHL